MDAATIEEKYQRLFRLAAKLRHHQARHYKYKTSVDFDKALYYGRQIDHFLKKELKDVPESLKQELFK